MLGNHPITPVLLATDLAAAREFYHRKLGLQIDRENENAIVFRCGNGTHLDVTESTVGTADQQTQAAWQVNDIHKVIAEMTGKGVEFTRYPYFEQSPDGVWTAPGGAKVAWFTDPDGNTLSISQH